LVLVSCSQSASKISTGSLSGKAYYKGQASSAGISITAAGFSTTTDAQGHYSFDEIPNGTVTVAAVAPLSAERTLATTVVVNGGTAAPDLVFSPQQTLAGQLTVLGVPAAGATVTLDGVTSTNTDANGIYSFPSASSGKHSLAFAAPGFPGDAIDTVYYSPATGASVPAAYTGAQYGLMPFDLQKANRLARVNLRAPAATVAGAPVLSPDGKYYAYRLSISGSIALYVGSTAGGSPALVTGSAANYDPQFSNDSTYLAYVVPSQDAVHPNPSGYQLYTATVSPGTTGLTPAIGTPLSIAEIYTGYTWTFSPQNVASGAGQTIYFVGWDQTNSMPAIQEVGVDGRSKNSFLGTSFWVSKKQRRVVMRLTGPSALPNHQLVSVPATAQQVTPTVIYEPQGATNFSLTFYGFSPDEQKFTYVVNGKAAGNGFMTATTGSMNVWPNSADVSIHCMAWNAGSSRIAWDNYSSYYTIAPDVGAVAVPYTGTAYNYYVCPAFTSDGRVWLAGPSNNVLIGKDDASVAPTALNDANPAGFYNPGGFGASGACWVKYNAGVYSYYCQGLGPIPNTIPAVESGKSMSGNIIGIGTGGALYTRYVSTSGLNQTFWVSLTAVSPTTGAPIFWKVATGSSSAPSNDRSKAIVYDSTSGNAAASVDMASGVRNDLLRFTSVANSRIQDVGTTTTVPTFIGFRYNSPEPWEFQDGVYQAAP
jgi:hypothetical protein